MMKLLATIGLLAILIVPALNVYGESAYQMLMTRPVQNDTNTTQTLDGSAFSNQTQVVQPTNNNMTVIFTWTNATQIVTQESNQTMISNSTNLNATYWMNQANYWQNQSDTWENKYLSLFRSIQTLLTQ